VTENSRRARGVLVDGVAHAAEAQPGEPHRGAPEDDLRGGAGLQGLEGMCAADLLLKDSALLQLHDVVLHNAARCPLRGSVRLIQHSNTATVLAASFPLLASALAGRRGGMGMEPAYPV
jgi:hypothetical protein